VSCLAPTRGPGGLPVGWSWRAESSRQAIRSVICVVWTGAVGTGSQISSRSLPPWSVTSLASAGVRWRR
jgi:hypothetical protein